MGSASTDFYAFAFVLHACIVIVFLASPIFMFSFFCVAFDYLCMPRSNGNPFSEIVSSILTFEQDLVILLSRPSAKDT